MSSDDEIFKLPCADKMAFDTQEAASAAALAIQHQRGTKLKAYRCRYCGLWHLASA